MDSLTIIWVIVCAYLLLNLLVGVYCHIRVKDSTDYLLAGRRIGVLMTAGTLAATEIGGGSTVGVAAKAYGSWGLSAGWYVVSAGIGVILVAFIAPLLRRAMATTVPEIIGRRFGASSHLITSILSMLATLHWQAYRLQQRQPLLAFSQDFQQSSPSSSAVRYS